MAVARCSIFREPGEPFGWEEKELPQCGPGEALVSVSLATICGSDLHTADGRRLEPAPSVLGHEGVGVVVAIGNGRDPSLLGKRVTWTLADSRGECIACREWQLPQKCQRLFKYGHARVDDGSGLNGCYASHILLRRGTSIFLIPDQLPDMVVAPANCALATMVNATEWLPAPCRVAIIQGAGLLGLYGCALLKSRGVERVVVVDTNEHRLALVEAFGGIPAYKTAAALVPAGGADAVFEVAGTSAVVPEGVRSLRTGGYYAFVGMVLPNPGLELSGQVLVRQCLTLRGFHNYAPRHLQRAVQFLLENRAAYPWERLVSPPFALDQITSAFETARTQTWARVSIKP
jgi:putative phosphonate catabolism associated alcohol dehydrogenase